MTSAKSRLGRYNRDAMYLLGTGISCCGSIPIALYDSLKKAQEAEKDEEGNRRKWTQTKWKTKKGWMVLWESTEYPARTIFEVPLMPDPKPTP